MNTIPKALRLLVALVILSGETEKGSKVFT